MRVLAVGGGAREHAIASALKRGGAMLFACMNNRNPGIARLAEEFMLVKETDREAIVKYAASKNIQLAVIGPEAPLEMGLGDLLRSAGIEVVGPSAEAARLETSKKFMRELMERHKIPGRARFLASDSMNEIDHWLDDHGYDVVVKPSGLTGGKGARIFGEHLNSPEEVRRYCSEIVEKRIGGSSTVVVEERLEGEEFTLQAFCDGRRLLPSPAVQDHKRAYEGDRGPNTGGMGSYSDSDHLLPFLSREEYDRALDVMRRTVDAMRAEGLDYRGILYGQFMLTRDGPKIIEYNARFGDPEAMNILPIMIDSFLEVAEGVATGSLSGGCRFAKRATVCKYVVPEGYGTSPLANQRIEVDEEQVRQAGAELFYAAVNETEEGILTTTSRSVGVVGKGDSIEEAESICERGLVGIGGRVFVRHDIGKRDLIMRRIEHMSRLRGASVA